MATKILDAYALTTFFEDEPGAETVRNLILKAEGKKLKLLISAINLGEVWRSIAGVANLSKANEYIEEIEDMAIEVVPADWPLTSKAVELQSRTKLSLESCFAVALAKLRHGELVTSDPTLRVVENEVKISWLV
jgi:predicted nucleic acid-binding protein